MQYRSWLVTMLALAACGDDNKPAIDAAEVAIDAAPIDAPASAALLGTWSLSPEANPALAKKYTFEPDGMLIVDEGSAFQVGTWSVVAPGRVVMTDQMTPTGVERDYVVGDGHLLVAAFLPQGTVTGFVGTWQTSTKQLSNMVVSTISITLASNMTATVTQVQGAGTPNTSQGTWAPASTGFAFTATMTGNVTQFRPIGTAAIGQLYYVKQ